MHRLRRALCWWMGCVLDDYNNCDRCGVNIYEPPGIHDAGQWWRIKRRLFRLFAPVVRKRCDVCGKSYWRGRDEYTCSQVCADNWIPF